MAEKDNKDLLITGGIIGLLLFAVYHLFFKKKKEVADSGDTQAGSGTGIAAGEPTPGTEPDGGTGSPTSGGGSGTPPVFSGVSDPDPWMVNSSDAPPPGSMAVADDASYFHIINNGG